MPWSWMSCDDFYMEVDKIQRVGEFDTRHWLAEILCAIYGGKVATEGVLVTLEEKDKLIVGEQGSVYTVPP